MADGPSLPNDPFATVDCTATVNQLYYYLDGELTEERRVEIELHLDHCGPCVDIVEFEAELRRVIADRCRDRVPPQLIERIAALIHLEAMKSEQSDA